MHRAKCIESACCNFLVKNNSMELELDLVNAVKIVIKGIQRA